MMRRLVAIALAVAVLVNFSYGLHWIGMLVASGYATEFPDYFASFLWSYGLSTGLGLVVAEHMAKRKGKGE